MSFRTINQFEMAVFSKATLEAGLYLVATPIGNLRDITLRALDVLASAEVIFCEDTRVTTTLLTAYGITTRLDTYHEHNAEKAREKILGLLAQRKAVALVSDAGTPLVSDPGFKLVREVRDQGYAVYSIPGASSVLAGLISSGLPTDQFHFLGFVPKKAGERTRFLQSLSVHRGSSVVFETARNAEDTLHVLQKLYPQAQVALARELTKKFEETLRGSPTEIIAMLAQKELRGEIVLIIALPEMREEIDLAAELKEAMKGASLKDAVQEVAARTGLPRKQVYAEALRLSRQKH